MKLLNAQTIKVGAQQFVKFARANLPTILTGLGIVSFGVTVYETSKATLRAEEELNKAKEEAEGDISKSDKAIIIVKTCWKAFLAGLITIGFFCGAHHISLKRQAALSAAYAMTTNEFKEYRDKVTETLGEKKAEKIKDDIVTDKAHSYSVNTMGDIKGNGTSLWVLPWTNTMFRSDRMTIDRAFIALNNEMFRRFDNEVTMNDIITILKVECAAPQLEPVANGDIFGFSPELTGTIEPDFRFGTTADGEPVGFINLDPEILTRNPRGSYIMRGF